MSIVKSYSLGSGKIRGDMFYIKHNSDNFTVIDCYLTEEDGRIDEIIEEIKQESTNRVCRFISTHPDNDHICGLETLNKNWPIENFYAVNSSFLIDRGNPSLCIYWSLLKNKNCPIRQGLERVFLNMEGELHGEKIGSSGIFFLWPNLSNKKFIEAMAQVRNGNSPNNISPVILYEIIDGTSFMWMGDMETDMQREFYSNSKDYIHNVDVLFAPHHGRDSGKVPDELLLALDPKIIVIGDAPSEHICYYDSKKTITQNLAGDIYFDCIDHRVRVYTKNKITNAPRILRAEPNCLKADWFYAGTLFLEK